MYVFLYAEHRRRKRPMHSLSSPEIYTRMCSAALLPVQPSPSPRDQVYVDSVCGGLLCHVGDHILQGFYTLASLRVIRFRTYKYVCPPQHKNLGSEGSGGLKQINSCRKVLLQVTLKTKSFCIAFYEPYIFHVSWTHLSCRHGEPSHEEQEGQRKGDLS